MILEVVLGLPHTRTHRYTRSYTRVPIKKHKQVTATLRTIVRTSSISQNKIISYYNEHCPFLWKGTQETLHKITLKLYSAFKILSLGMERDQQ